MKKRFVHFKTISGISLLEVMLVLGAISVLLISITRYYIASSNTEKVNRAVGQLLHLMTASDSWKGKAPDYQGISAQALGEAGLLLPNEYDFKTGTLSSPFGGPIIITPASLNGLLHIEYRQLDSTVCKELVQTFRNTYPENGQLKCTGGGASGYSFIYEG